ncbi:MAG: hypothetical protein ACYC5Q_13410 [Thermoleophilia bacterium]
MTTYVEITTASQGLLPSPCPECVWWQTTQGDNRDTERRLEWMQALEESWGSVGLVALDGREVIASIQFAPVRSLPRLVALSSGEPPEDSVLLFCLRGRVGRPSLDTQELLHRAMAHLRHKHVQVAYAYARPLGTSTLCGVLNLFGLEFLEANGFTVVRAVGEAYLMQVDLGGLVPALAEARWTVRRLLGVAAHPSPATFNRS